MKQKILFQTIALALASNLCIAQNATTTLNNLTSPTSVNQSLIPSANNSKNLGSSGKGWKSIYATGTYFMGSLPFLGSIAGTGTDNTFCGINALSVNTSGGANSAFGKYGLYSNTTGSKNIAVGAYSLGSNTIGNYNIAIGTYSLSGNIDGNNNIAIGESAMGNNSIGSDNTTVGASSLFHNTTGYWNTGTGSVNLYTNTTGIGNTANGYAALYLNTTGSENTACGHGALYSNTTASNNTAIGSLSLFYNTTGINNTASGYKALYYNTTGNNNLATGYQALYKNTTGVNNTATGYGALNRNTTGSYNVATGFDALFNNTTGSDNHADGYKALYSNINGINNVANGEFALYSNNSGSYNTATGMYALKTNTSGGLNVAEGYNALYSNTTGGHNTAIGHTALYSNTTGGDNTAVGYQALYYNHAVGSLNGINNTAVGMNALVYNIVGSNNTAIGHDALFNNVDGTDNVAVGDSAFFNGSNGQGNVGIGKLAGSVAGVGSSGNWNTCIGFKNAHQGGDNCSILGAFATDGYDPIDGVMLGNTSITSVRAAADITTYSDGRVKDNVKANVPGLLFISQLRPVTYNLNIHRLNEIVYKGVGEMPDCYAKYLGEKITQSGFIAQEVEQAANDVGYDFNGISIPKTKDGLYGLKYSEFVVPLVKAVQELDSMNTMKDEKINKLENEIAEMKTMMQAFEQSLTECCNNFQSSNGNVHLAIGNQPTDVAKLEQNQPNPFNENTVIRFYIPSSAKSALIKIADANSKEIKSISIDERGASQISISSNTLAAGVYTYQLIVDGKAVDTKKMTLTK
ncbi:MAG: tail fiber domain-containing protein [Bacteroidia bacterium]